ncbi:hypothetical protein DYI37_11410 [Fulvimarina endophytica]|uniref:DUF2635 domain-containing protein n=1 Tax=Fulvimarina endophytica TaxID=2293836 RepID=A0A371X318_9HYPH|nr:hypothetical protein [Fulvimarina endophytica]RFC63606.1 hypothetical protein DYI37_11410 [Fulvimarina endophytica]
MLLPDGRDWPREENGDPAAYPLGESRYRRRRLRDRDLVEVDASGKPIADAAPAPEGEHQVGETKEPGAGAPPARKSEAKKD